MINSGPIGVSLDATNLRYYSTGLFSNCTFETNHAVLLVAVTKKYWKINNSWGTVWG